MVIGLSIPDEQGKHDTKRVLLIFIMTITYLSTFLHYQTLHYYCKVLERMALIMSLAIYQPAWNHVPT